MINAKINKNIGPQHEFALPFLLHCKWMCNNFFAILRQIIPIRYFSVSTALPFIKSHWDQLLYDTKDVANFYEPHLIQRMISFE